MADFKSETGTVQDEPGTSYHTLTKEIISKECRDQHEEAPTTQR